MTYHDLGVGDSVTIDRGDGTLVVVTVLEVMADEVGLAFEPISPWLRRGEDAWRLAYDPADAM